MGDKAIDTGRGGVGGSSKEGRKTKRDGERQRRRIAVGERFIRGDGTSGRGGDGRRGEATEGDRREKWREEKEGGGRYMRAKQEEDRESSPTVCRLPAAAAHSWIVLPIRLRREKEKGLRSLVPPPLPSLPTLNHHTTLSLEGCCAPCFFIF